MPQVKNIISEKYFNKFINDEDFNSNTSDFTNNLVGNTGIEIKAEITLSLEWFAAASSFDEFNLQSDRVKRNAGSFKADGFNVGDVFDFRLNYNTASESTDFTGTISGISADGRTLFFTTGGTPTLNTYDNVAIRALMTDSANYLTALIYKFGLIENQEELNFNSKVSDNEQIYYAVNVGEDSGGRLTNEITGVAQGSYMDWVTGSLTAQYFDTGNDYEQGFIIRHEFVINPYYLDGEIINITDNIIPDLLTGNNSLKYVYQIEARRVLSNPNTGIIIEQENNLGSVGYFRENFNGYENLYNIESVSYQDANTLDTIDSIQIERKTKVTVVVEKVGSTLSVGQRIGVYHSYLPEQSEYTNTTTDFKTNFLYENIYHNEGDSVKVGTGIIKSLDSSISAGKLVVEFEIEYNVMQQLRLSETSNYALWIEIADSSLNSGNSDKVELQTVNNYISTADVSSLINNNSSVFYTHDLDFGIDSGLSSLEKVWNEDGILFVDIFNIDLNNEAVINSIDVFLVAHNQSSNSFFELDSYSYDISNAVISSGVQQINVDTTRGYILSDNDQFNWVKVETGTQAAGLQTYTLKLGQKISWEDWIQNLNADTVFFNSSQPNDNLNFKSSNYSGLNGYEIKMLVRVGLTGLVENKVLTGVNNIFSGLINILDYSVSADWTATIQTFDPDNLSNLQGNIKTDKDTLFRVTWNNTGGAVTDISDVYGIHRIEKENELGKQIYELSSIRNRPINNLLKPLDGESFLKLSIVSGDVVAEGLIDYTLLDASNNYKLSSRINQAPEIPANARVTSSGQVRVINTGETRVINP